MADATPPPVLPSTADTVPYVPVSWMAVAAATLSGLFVVVLLALGVSAFIGKKPLVIPELLILAVAGLVLSFAARRMIRNSEGTRTGENLANAAWWASLLVGLAYAAYLFGLDYSVRRDAQEEVRRWVGHLVKPDAKETDFNDALIRTQEPGRRANLNRENTADLVAQLREPYLAFQQCDLVQIARRNPGACEFTPGGVKDWLSKTGLIECSVVGTLKCPEGTFPLEIPLRGLESIGKSETVGRQWHVVFPPNGYVQRDQTALTPYGWLLAELEQSGGMGFPNANRPGFGYEFINVAGRSPLDRAYLYQTNIRPDAKPEAWRQVQTLSLFRFPGPNPATVLPFVDYAEHLTNFVRAPGGGELSAEKKSQFAKLWTEYGLLLPGKRLTNNDKIDAHDVLSVNERENRVEVRVPCEVPLSGAAGNLAAARGRLVVACSDPELMADLKRFRAEANPDKATTMPPDNTKRRSLNWRPLFVETDMHEVQVQRQGQGGPGGPGMPGMPGG